MVSPSDAHYAGLAASLLAVLRSRTGIRDLGYAEEPKRVTGGYWADILAFRLAGAPPELERRLIVRVMPDDRVARREIMVQSAVVAQGFPAPALRLWGGAEDGLGGPYVVMDRAPGRTPLPSLGGAATLRSIAVSGTSLADLLARVTAKLHRLDAAPLRLALDAAPDVVGAVDGYLDRFGRNAEELGRLDLVEVVEWLFARAPPRRRDTICHGDLHPLNILVDAGRATVLDWSAALVAEPAYDLAFTAMVLGLAPLERPRPVSTLLGVAGRAVARRFMHRYRHHAGPGVVPIGRDELRWFTGFHCLRALVDAAGRVRSRGLDASLRHPYVASAPIIAKRLEGVVGCPVRPF